MTAVAEKRPSRRRAGPGPVRLVLLIGATAYRVRPVRTFWPRASAFRLEKPDGTLYDVTETEHGPSCDCPDFVFRRDGLDPDGCKHIRALATSGLIGRAATTAGD